MVCTYCNSETHTNRNSLLCKFNIRNSKRTNDLLDNQTEIFVIQGSPKRTNTETLISSNSPTTEIRSSINSINLNTITKKCNLCGKTNHKTNRSIHCQFYSKRLVKTTFF